MRILRTHTLPVYKLRSDAFRIRRIRPGAVFQGHGKDQAIGPLAAVDHAWLGAGNVVPMHEHRNDEILSYVISGTMLHDDSAGQARTITATRLMMMNAGRSFWHEESTPYEPVEMLQIFVRPEAEDLAPNIQFHDRPEHFMDGQWNLLTGPIGSGAPLTVRNRIYIFDAHPKAGSTLAFPHMEGFTPWAFVASGTLEGEGVLLRKGDVMAEPAQSLPELRVVEDATVVTFLTHVHAPSVLSGTQSGYARGLARP